jgi:hypothetical protein
VPRFVKPSGGIERMRYLLAFLSMLSLSVVCADVGSAQLSSNPPSRRELLRQDSEECARQVDRKQVDVFAQCMNKKETDRKVAERQRKAEEAAKRRQQRTERFDAAAQANREANQQRMAKENAARAKRDDCKKQAKEQKLHLMKRLNFIKSCMEK